MSKTLTKLVRQPVGTATFVDTAAWRRHAVCRGDFAALVFCGATSRLGELPGEPTAHTLYKFALPDLRLDKSEDFARSHGMALPLWPVERVQPIPGVCFVFGDADHPHIDRLRVSGAVEHEHYIAMDAMPTDLNDDLAQRLTPFMERVSKNSVIGLLGYGHQGVSIARCLMDQFGIAADLIMVLDGNDDSLEKSRMEGCRTAVHESELLGSAQSLIYSPLARYERLCMILDKAMVQRLPVFDNARIRSELRQFTSRGLVKLDGAADRALHVQSTELRHQAHGLALTCSLIREDLRRINGVQFPHLHGGHRIAITSSECEINLSLPAPGEPLDRSTFVRMQRAFVSLRVRADLGFFAARDLCERLWPAATQSVFPSQHAIDLGATGFEQLLQAHLDARELVSTMQTPSQRVTLGIAAAHYAGDRTIVEIGSAFGGSALLMSAATASRRPSIYSIDPETSTRDIMRFAFQRHGQLDRLHQIIQPSETAIHQLQHLRGKAGLVFIDGLHTRAGVSADFEAYAPLVGPGGALVFHDVAPQIYSVMRFVFEKVLTDRRFEAMCLVDGLLVFRRREKCT